MSHPGYMHKSEAYCTWSSKARQAVNSAKNDTDRNHKEWNHNVRGTAFYALWKQICDTRRLWVTPHAFWLWCSAATYLFLWKLCGFVFLTAASGAPRWRKRLLRQGATSVMSLRLSSSGLGVEHSEGNMSHSGFSREVRHAVKICFSDIMRVYNFTSASFVLADRDRKCRVLGRLLRLKAFLT